MPQICGDPDGAPSIRCLSLFWSRYFFHTLESIDSSPLENTHKTLESPSPWNSLVSIMPTSLIEVPPDVAQLREDIFNISHG
jgi:hypothetical protein